MAKTTNMLLVGVGGQGTILASKVVSQVLLKNGYQVKMNEIHGMSQRGGSVITHVRFGDQVHSPIVDQGQADIVVAFEELEAMRYLDYLKEDGVLVINSQQIHPTSVATGKASYPENIVGKIRERLSETIVVDAVEQAKNAGNMKAANVVLLGALAKKLALPVEQWLTVLEEVVPPRFIDENKRAFQLGYEG